MGVGMVPVEELVSGWSWANRRDPMLHEAAKQRLRGGSWPTVEAQLAQKVQPGCLNAGQDADGLVGTFRYACFPVPGR